MILACVQANPVETWAPASQDLNAVQRVAQSMATVPLVLVSVALSGKAQSRLL